MKKFAVLSCLLLTLPVMVQAQLKVCSLRVEHCVNPNVVDVRKPRFSWVNEPKKANMIYGTVAAYLQMSACWCLTKVVLWPLGRIAIGKYRHGTLTGNVQNGVPQLIGVWDC